MADTYTQQMEQRRKAEADSAAAARYFRYRDKGQRYASGNARWAIEANGAVWSHSQYGHHWQFAEPDARRLKCDACSKAKVYGLEELLRMGLLHLEA